MIPMNSSLFTADRTTHLKVVIVSLIASIAVVAVAVTAHTTRESTGVRMLADGPPIKAQKLLTVTSSDASAIR